MKSCLLESKKQDVVSRSSAEFEYQAIANITCELVCIQDLLRKLHLLSPTPMWLYWDNQAVIHIVENLIFHERTKYIEVDCHIVCQKVVDDKIVEIEYFLF